MLNFLILKITKCVLELLNINYCFYHFSRTLELLTSSFVLYFLYMVVAYLSTAYITYILNSAEHYRFCFLQLKVIYPIFIYSVFAFSSILIHFCFSIFHLRSFSFSKELPLVFLLLHIYWQKILPGFVCQKKTSFHHPFSRIFSMGL